MKRAFVAVVCLSLLAAACSDDTDDAAPPPTEATTTTAEAPAAAPAPITPEVVCVRFDGAVFFAYANDADTPVVLDDDSSVLAGARADDEPYVPTVFAAGRVSPAFYAYPGDATTAPTWTVTGPDAESRTATPHADTPECTVELVTPTVADPRTPVLEVTSAAVSPDGGTITIDVTLTGVPEPSVCSDDLTAEPAEITMDDGDGGGTVEGTTSTWTLPVATGPDGTPGGVLFPVAALVVDRCSTDGATQSSWPTGTVGDVPRGAFEDLRNGLSTCVRLVDGEATASPFSPTERCGGPPLTGGARTRPG